MLLKMRRVRNRQKIIAHHVTFVCRQVILSVCAQTAVNITIFRANQIPTKQAGYNN